MRVNKGLLIKGCLLACIAFLLSLAACGGGSKTNASGTTASASPLASTTALFMGFLGTTDTIRLEMDFPAAGQATVRFVHSQIGLAGSLSGRYAKDASGTYTLSAIVLDGSVPAAVSAALQKAAIGFHIVQGSTGSMLLGQLTLPPVGAAAAVSYPIQMTIPATIDITKLAGVYSYLGALTTLVGSDLAVVSVNGQIAVSANGALVHCPGAQYSASCADVPGDTIGQHGTLAVAADQGTVPGELQYLNASGTRVGRLFATYLDGTYRLMVQWNNDTVAYPKVLAYWVPPTVLSAGAFNGNYACAAFTGEGSDLARLSAALAIGTGVTLLTVSGTTIALGAQFYNAALNSAGGYALPGVYTAQTLAVAAVDTAALSIGAGNLFITAQTPDPAGSTAIVGGFGVCGS